ncbi:DUF4397 domain-containing protein [Aquiflexum sp. TKW24L]|uniref:DUF4397 domain-containing protein n=1 Tax=Aquiflexum sp. TKW24L TaxID=2942212 RepID=UPI0020C086F2|nr:DUF4397 domain-containing protein [Aquiflexum sp. TKW24L]MCL6261185.1 DUF4397 domain-containing protein [Aquiflexum sp. TKW24L]
MMITELKTKFSGILRSVSALFLSLFLFAGCVPDLDQPAQPPSAFVAIYHGSPDGPDLDIYAESRKINNQALLFGQTFPYSGFFAGERRLRFNPFNAQNTLLEKNVNLAQDKIYTVFLVNKAADLDAIQVEDIWEEPDGVKSQLRLVHLSPDSGDLEVSIADQTPFGTATSYLSVTDFLQHGKGKVKVVVKSKTSGEILVTVDEIELLGNRVYSLIIRGFENPSNGNNPISVQLLTNFIKF